MRILLLCTMFMLGGCESLGEVIREKKYNVQVYEFNSRKHYSKQTFGYNDDHDYVGFMIEGQFQ